MIKYHGAAEGDVGGTLAEQPPETLRRAAEAVRAAVSTTESRTAPACPPCPVTMADMVMACPSCGAAYQAKQIDWVRGIAECASCGGLRVLPAPSAPAPASTPTQPPPTRPVKVPIPASITRTSDGDRLLLTRRWFRPMLFVLLIFCIFWNSFLLVWYGVAIAAASSGAWMALVFMIFPLGHVAVGAALSYITVAGLMNRTEFAVSCKALSVRHAPLPWPGNRTIASEHISQLYVEETRHHGRNGPRFAYLLNLVTADNRKVKLCKFHERDEALYIESEIEQFLQIPDESIRGEYASRG